LYIFDQYVKNNQTGTIIISLRLYINSKVQYEQLGIWSLYSHASYTFIRVLLSWTNISVCADDCTRDFVWRLLSTHR